MNLAESSLMLLAASLQPSESSPESSWEMDSLTVSGSDADRADLLIEDPVTAAPADITYYLTMEAPESEYGGSSPFTSYEYSTMFLLFGSSIVLGFVLSCLINLAGMGIGIVSKMLRKGG